MEVAGMRGSGGPMTQRGAATLRAALAAVLVAATALAGLGVAPAPVAAADPVAITEAPDLVWGFKHSWRAYVDEVEVSAGASVVPGSETATGLYDVGWTFASGTYDDETRTTVLHYEGTAHWTRYVASEMPGLKPPSYDGPMDIFILDVTVSDPVVTISAEGSSVTASVTSRDLDTWEMWSDDDARLVALDTGGVTPTVAGGETTWSAIPGFAGADAAQALANYAEGVAVDPVSFRYVGPGGAPDLSESWTEPGTTTLALAENEILNTVASNGFEPWWFDPVHRIVHYRYHDKAPVSTRTWTYFAYSLDTMERIGTPLTIANSASNRPTAGFHFADDETGRVLYENGGTSYAIGFDRTAGTYTITAQSGLLPYIGNRTMAWDPVGDRAVNIARTVPSGVGTTDYDAHVWMLNTYTETTPGVWERTSYPLPSFPTGLNRVGYASTVDLNRPSIATAPDGSFVVLAETPTSNDPEVPVPTSNVGAYRVTIDGATAHADPIEGTEIATPFQPFTAIGRGPGGQMTLIGIYSGSGPFVQDVTVGDGGSLTVGPRTIATGQDTFDPDNIAVDPVDGTVWVGGWQNQRVVGIAEGRIVTDQTFGVYHPRGGMVMTGLDGRVYVQTNDGSPAGFGGSPIYGVGLLERLGVSPTVATDPAPATATLGVGEASEEVAFTSTATGDPAPDRRWQVKAPGSARFVDIADATAETLTVTAVPGMDGSEYRAVYENAAGRLASETALLTVAHAPIIDFQPPDIAVLAGADATFDLVASGSPEPEVTWQRYAAGFWWNIGPDDDGFTLTETSLTVTGTNIDQDGTRIRARVRNEVATVHSRVATLSVTEPTEEPQHVVGGVLDWGVRQSFRTYITGSIAHGAIATSDGAIVDTDDTFLFPAAPGGVVDGDVIDAGFDGTVRFTGHVGAGTPPGVPALDMRVTDIRIAVEGQDGTLVADVVSRGLEDGALTTYDDVVFADLDLSAVTPTPVEDGLRWTGVPATLTEAGVPAFADFYEAGSALDPLTFTLALSDEEPTPERTPTESFATAALVDLLGDEPTGEQVTAAVTAVEATGKTTFLRSLTTSDPWLEAIVDDLYADTLGRPASADDLAFWTGRLRAGWTVARVAASFYAAPEYYDGIGGGTDATWVADLYTTLLGRTGAADEIDYWVDETAARGRGNVALRFYQTSESARTRVARLYEHLLGRAPSGGDLDFWSAQVVRRGDLTLAVSLALSPEYQARAETRYP
jgi:hypothetical protein